MIAARRFHDEYVDLGVGKNRALHDRLIVEVDIAGVENCFTLPRSRIPEELPERGPSKNFFKGARARQSPSRELTRVCREC